MWLTFLLLNSFLFNCCIKAQLSLLTLDLGALQMTSAAEKRGGKQKSHIILLLFKIFMDVYVTESKAEYQQLFQLIIVL